MVQRYHRAFILLLAIAVSLWTSDCLAQDDTSTTEGTCKADDPGTCEVVADNVADNIVEDVVEDNDEDDDKEDGEEEDDDEEEDEVEEGDCQDKHPKCRQWGELGECFKNPKYMLKNCKRACLQCPHQAEELRKKNREWTEEELKVGADMGEPQRLENTDFRVSAEEASARIVKGREQIRNLGLDGNILDICKNQHEDCTTW